jgi:hypothetical protein
MTFPSQYVSVFLYHTTAPKSSHTEVLGYVYRRHLGCRIGTVTLPLAEERRGQYTTFRHMVLGINYAAIKKKYIMQITKFVD